MIIQNSKKVSKRIWSGKKEGRNPNSEFIVTEHSRLVDDSLTNLRRIAPPMAYKKVEEFAKEKASETLSNVALNTYKKYGETSPIISIENPPYGSAISNAEDLKNLIIDTRKKFTNKTC